MWIYVGLIDTAYECCLHGGSLMFGTQIKQLATLENCIEWQVVVMVQDYIKGSDFKDRKGNRFWCTLYILHLSLRCLQWMNTDVENNPLSRFVPNKNLRKANCAFTEELENDPVERGNCCLRTSRIYIRRILDPQLRTSADTHIFQIKFYDVYSSH